MAKSEAKESNFSKTKKAKKLAVFSLLGPGGNVAKFKILIDSYFGVFLFNLLLVKLTNIILVR
ncbi:MAG: hypothetical protein IPJ90_05815 [Anaerolineaceae bacterium]|nr:hypothetical protein [Anaerolineaceae bacterium]